VAEQMRERLPEVDLEEEPAPSTLMPIEELRRRLAQAPGQVVFVRDLERLRKLVEDIINSGPDPEMFIEVKEVKAVRKFGDRVTITVGTVYDGIFHSDIDVTIVMGSGGEVQELCISRTCDEYIEDEVMRDIVEILSLIS